MTESSRSLVGLCIMALVLIGQIVGLVRYLHRLPDDRIGVALYVMTIAAVTAAVFLLFMRVREADRLQ